MPSSGDWLCANVRATPPPVALENLEMSATSNDGPAGRPPLGSVPNGSQDILTSSGSTGSPSVGDAANSVLLVLLDDVGTELLDWMGVGARYTTDPAFAYAPTPFLSRVAAEGVWFSQFYATPLCSPSRARLWTGLRSDQTGIGQNLREPSTPVSPRFPTTAYTMNQGQPFLARTIRAAKPSVSTAYFGKWHVSDMWSYVPRNAREEFPPDANLQDYARLGFQHFTGGPLPYGGSYEWWKIVDGVPTYVKPPPFDETTFVGAVETAAAATWLSARTGPFFCVVSLDPPHTPLTVPPLSMLSDATRGALRSQGLEPGQFVRFTQASPVFKLAYRTAIECADTAVARVWNAVPAALKPTTTLIVLSDNGTQLGAVPTGFQHYKSQLFWGGTRVPCLAYGHRVVHPGREAPQIADVGDVFATVIDLMGLGSRAADVAPESKSLVPILSDTLPRADVQAHKPYVFEQLFYPIGATRPNEIDPATRGRAITDGRHRLVVPIDEEGRHGLYDTATDPLELVNVVERQPEVHRRLLDSLNARLPL